MKTLSLLGSIFLPSTFIASMFSMTFFNFQAASDGDVGIVSPLLWVYFVICIPLTLGIVAIWRWWDQKREAQYAAEDIDLEAGIETMESQIMSNMRKRTLSKVRTWSITNGKTE
jgi:hypothetical protein